MKRWVGSVTGTPGQYECVIDKQMKYVAHVETLQVHILGSSERSTLFIDNFFGIKWTILPFQIFYFWKSSNSPPQHRIGRGVHQTILTKGTPVFLWCLYVVESRVSPQKFGHPSREFPTCVPKSVKPFRGAKVLWTNCKLVWMQCSFVSSWLAALRFTYLCTQRIDLVLRVAKVSVQKFLGWTKNTLS